MTTLPASRVSPSGRAHLKYTDEQAHDVRRRYADGEYLDQIARATGVNKLVVQAMVMGRDFYRSQIRYRRFRGWPPVIRTEEAIAKANAAALRAKGSSFRRLAERRRNGEVPTTQEAIKQSRINEMRRIMQEKNNAPHPDNCRSPDCFDGPPPDIHAQLLAHARQPDPEPPPIIIDDDPRPKQSAKVQRIIDRMLRKAAAT